MVDNQNMTKTVTLFLFLNLRSQLLYKNKQSLLFDQIVYNITLQLMWKNAKFAKNKFLHLVTMIRYQIGRQNGNWPK